MNKFFLFFFILFSSFVTANCDPQLIWSTYLGGTDADDVDGMIVDSLGNSYLSGTTVSTDFPTITGAYQTSNKGAYGNFFISKLDSSGSNLIFSTYLGGNGADQTPLISLDKYGLIYLTGGVWGGNYFYNTFPRTKGAYDTSYNNYEETVVCKLSQNADSLIYSTFLGNPTYISGKNYSWGFAIDVDTFGNSYITGRTTYGFPTTPGAYDRKFKGESQCYITKLNSLGTDLIFSTFIGGDSLEFGRSIKIDSIGNAFIAGSTNSNNFPTTKDAFDRIYNGNGDGFVTKLNAKGSALIYSTFVGGNNSDNSSSINIDKYENAYILGETASSDFPTVAGAYDSTFSSGVTPYECDLFVTKLNSEGSSLIYSTYIGGNSQDEGHSIAIDNNNNVVITGRTFSSTFPISKDAFDSIYRNKKEGFITELNTNGNNLLYSTYFKGYGWCININKINNSLFIAGGVDSSDLPTTKGAYDEYYRGDFSGRGGDGYVTKFALINATLQIPIIKGCPGDTIEIPIYLKNPQNINESGATSFTADLSFNASLLMPLAEPKGKASNGQRTISLNMPVLDIKGDKLTKIKFIVGLGNDTITPLLLTNYTSIGGKVTIDTINGEFHLECVCHEGGVRLINVDAILSLTCNPNPANDKIQFDFETIEDGYTELYITDMLGNKVVKVFESSVHGKYSIESDLSLFYRGIYAYTLQTPTSRVSKLFMFNN
jgi:hypothetical protein